MTCHGLWNERTSVRSGTHTISYRIMIERSINYITTWRARITCNYDQWTSHLLKSFLTFSRIMNAIRLRHLWSDQLKILLVFCESFMPLFRSFSFLPSLNTPPHPRPLIPPLQCYDVASLSLSFSSIHTKISCFIGIDSVCKGGSYLCFISLKGSLSGPGENFKHEEFHFIHSCLVSVMMLKMSVFKMLLFY